MSVWMTDNAECKAYVDEADVDFWTVRGWRRSDEPAPGERVWLQHEGHGGRQLFNAAVVPMWGQLGWLPSAPPDPVDLLKDPVVAEAAAEDEAESPAEDQPSARKTSKPTKASEKE